ncbi:hypothetical protein RJ639_031557 [Escallonia herrerae]|uniref:Uncharacterized protein n=1 Tax=Escallonia herrerae TaxID=1293975 RepID=A0AA89BB00_9ASTE|nr:hypothetical protein RJ639_031557 [Escallonia herrerae]
MAAVSGSALALSTPLTSSSLRLSKRVSDCFTRDLFNTSTTTTPRIQPWLCQYLAVGTLGLFQFRML